MSEYEPSSYEFPGLADDDPAGSADAALDRLKALHLTAAAVAPQSLDAHFDQLLERQRKLISEYLGQTGEPRDARRRQHHHADDDDGQPGGLRRRPLEHPMSGVIAVLGFGEAGSLIARDLVAAGAAVRGFDPKVPPPDGVVGADSDAEAVIGADLVLSLNSAGEAVAALTASLDTLAPGAVWADLNTASPAVKRRLADIGAGRGIPVTDIAMMAPVPGKGLRVPMLASGDAEFAAATLRGYGADVAVLDGRPGRHPQAPAQCFLQGHVRVHRGSP